MTRGGRRAGSGGVSTWRFGKTKTIRVPVELSNAVLAFARELDGSSISSLESKPVSKAPVLSQNVIDLSGVSVAQIGGEIAVKLEDLVKLGYILQPDSLSKMVDARIRRKNSK